MIEKEVINSSICYECGKEFTNTDSIKYVSNKRFHEKCFKKFTNRANGRPYECPKCNKTNNNLFSLKTATSGCDLCGGYGYIAENLEAVYTDNVICYKGKESGIVVL